MRQTAHKRVAKHMQGAPPHGYKTTNLCVPHPASISPLLLSLSLSPLSSPTTGGFSLAPTAFLSRLLPFSRAYWRHSALIRPVSALKLTHCRIKY